MIDTVTIPSGDYTIGHSSAPLSRPVHTVQVASFKVMVGTVTNHQFAQFVSAGGYRENRYWAEIGVRWRDSKNARMPAFWGNSQFDGIRQPVVGVSWYEALAYANWLADSTSIAWRLPTEIEWEVAAQGDGAGTIYTASNQNGMTINAIGEGYQSTNGTWNMLGNVWEWCSTRWGRNWQSLDYAYPYDATDGRENLEGSHARVMRGGSWFDIPQQATSYARARYLPGSRGSNIGFRLVHDADFNKIML